MNPMQHGLGIRNLELFTLYLCYDGGYTTTFSAIIYPAAMVAIQAMEAISSVIPVCQEVHSSHIAEAWLGEF